MTERIVAAAIKSEDLVFSIEAPARHGDVISGLHGLGLKDECHGEQGFITSSGRFVGRWQALRIAMEADQLKSNTIVNINRELFSEDLW